MVRNSITVFVLTLLLSSLAQAQVTDSTHVNKKRLRGFVIGSTVTYGITLAGLNELWYKDAGHQSFQFFDDNDEWKQVDKTGHFLSAFYLSYGTSRALQWCQVKPKKSDLIGALVGFGVMVPIEIFDGFSQAYGASTGDLLADAAGAAFYLGQARLWKEPRIFPNSPSTAPTTPRFVPTPSATACPARS